MFLLACHHAGRIQLDLKKFGTVEDFIDKKTLGQLHVQFEAVEQKHGYTPDSNLHTMLEDAVQMRNLLSHRFFQNHDPITATAQDHAAMLKQLGEIRLSVGNAYLSVREMRKVAELQFGVTEEDIDALVRRVEGQQ